MDISKLMLKNSAGKKDAIFTFAVVAFAIVTFRVVVGMVGTIAFGDKSFTFQEMDAGLVASYLTPILVTYYGRRKTEKEKNE